MTVEEMRKSAKDARKAAHEAREEASQVVSGWRRRDLMIVSENELLRSTIWDAAAEICEGQSQVEQELESVMRYIRRLPTGDNIR